MPSRWLAVALCCASCVCSVHAMPESVVADTARAGMQLSAALPLQGATAGQEPVVQLTVRARDDDEIADYLLLRMDRDSAPLLLIAGLWGVFLAGLGIAHWRARRQSKVFQ